MKDTLQSNTLDLKVPGRAAPPPKPQKKRWRPSKQVLFVGLASVVIVAAGIVAVVMVWPREKAVGEGEAAAKAVAARVSRHYILPTDEKPALATITDKTKLTSPAFHQAENGDKILIYQKNKMAVIYRPDKDRIVAIVPVTIDEPTNITKQDGK